MRAFTVPTLWRDEVLRDYARLNELHDGRSRIVEVYGSHPANAFGSGRAAVALPQVEADAAWRHVALARELGFSFNYLINAGCLGGIEGTYEGQRELRRLLRELAAAGVDRVTVTSPMVMELAAEYAPELTVGASVICYVDSVDRLRFFERLGVKRVSLDIDVTRDFPLIRALRGATDLELGLIVNSLCRLGCPMKVYHYNVNAHFSQRGQYVDEARDPLVRATTLNYVGGRCVLQNHGDPAEVMRTAWVRAEDVGLYEEAGIDLFKVQGRGARPESMLATVGMYMAGRAPSRLMPLSLFAPGRAGYCLDNEALDGFLEHFVAGPYECRMGCGECRHCDDYAAAAVREDVEPGVMESLLEGARKTVREAIGFADSVDAVTAGVVGEARSGR